VWVCAPPKDSRRVFSFNTSRDNRLVIAGDAPHRYRAGLDGPDMAGNHSVDSWREFLSERSARMGLLVVERGPIVPLLFPTEKSYERSAMRRRGRTGLALGWPQRGFDHKRGKLPKFVGCAPGRPSSQENRDGRRFVR